jgi:hypothetical protein
MSNTINVKHIFELMTSNDAKPSCEIGFRLGGREVQPERVRLQFFRRAGSYSYGRDNDQIEVQINSEYIEQLVQERMKQMFSIQVDAMFAKSAEVPK